MNKAQRLETLTALIRRQAEEGDCCTPIPEPICDLHNNICHTCPYFDIDRHADNYVELLAEQVAKDLERLKIKEDA